MNPSKLFARIFKRKRKLPSGRRLWRTDPDVRRMVKQINAYSSDRMWVIASSALGELPYPPKYR